MQHGSIKQHGKWWMLKYRADVLSNGATVRKDRYKKLAPIDRNHQAKPDGSPPQKVRDLADIELSQARVNQPTSADSLKSFLEAFLATGEGGQGYPLNTTTRTSYKAMFNMSEDFLPDMELGQVRAHHIDKLLRDLANADGEDRRAQSSYSNLKNFLSSAFRYAVRHGLIEFNPVREVAIPRGKPADTHAYTLEEVHTLVRTLTNPLSRTLVIVAMFTGMRIEEIKGLRWEDYDGEVLDIRRAVVYGKLVDPKTDASRAPIPAIGIVRKVLEAHRKLNPGDGYIFEKDGKPLIVDNHGRHSMRSTLSKNNIQWHGFHSFRRGLATYLEVNLQLPRERVKRILRHTTQDITGKHYVKPDIEESRKALEMVESDFLKLEPGCHF